MTASFDYVIVGSGAAGSVLAERLSASSASTVLVVEAGGSDRNPLHLVPGAWRATSSDPRYSRRYATTAEGRTGGEVWPRGRVLGGSTTVNGMTWNRGWAPAYEAWERAGNHGWNWARFLDAYRAIEHHEIGDAGTAGTDGRVGISRVRSRDAVSNAFVTSLDASGVRCTDDVNASGSERVGYASSNVRNGLRVSASRAFLHRAARRHNVTVLTGTEVKRITFDGTRAGVEAIQRGATIQFTARREVLVCAGTLESPLLLERSGIGDPQVLQRAGVPLRVPRSLVGENLREHHGVLFQFELAGRVGYNHQLSSWFKQGRAGARFLFTRGGVLSHSGTTVLAMYRSGREADHPDVQAFLVPMSYSGVDANTGRPVLDRGSGAMVLVYPTFPTSRGSIHITGSQPAAPPKLVPRFLSTCDDREVLIGAFRRMRAFTRTEPFAHLVTREVAPSETIDRDQEIVEYGLEHGVTAQHAVGTCALGPGDDDVVDEQLRVRGTTHLRVADASVFPMMPSGNTAAPTMALGWIAAEIISGEETKETSHGPRREEGAGHRGRRHRRNRLSDRQPSA